MKCYFGDKESCTDMCWHYKTCIWSEFHLRMRSDSSEIKDIIKLDLSKIDLSNFDIPKTQILNGFSVTDMPPRQCLELNQYCIYKSDDLYSHNMEAGLSVDILGEKYCIIEENFGDKNIDGYCDFTNREIHIRKDNVNELGNFESNKKKQLRHEIIHAFMAESGLQMNWQHQEEFGHDETTVDWFAIQFPKILKVFKEIGCED